MPEEGHPALQAPGSCQAGSGRVSPRCVCVPACPFRRDFASAGRSPKAVPEKRGAAAAARETMAVRETAVPTSTTCRSNEGNRSSEENSICEGNSSASQGRHPSSCPTSPACKQPNLQTIPSALHADNPGSPTGSPTISQSRQRMLRVAGPEQERVALRTVKDSCKALPRQQN